MTWASIAAWALKNILYLIIVALVIGMLVYGAYHLFGDGARQAAATANGTAAVSAAGNASAHGAVQTVAGNANHETIVHDTVRTDHETIIREPGASVPVSDGVDDAGRRAICMHDSAAGLPECQRLRQPGP